MYLWRVVMKSLDDMNIELAMTQLALAEERLKAVKLELDDLKERAEREEQKPLFLGDLPVGTYFVFLGPGGRYPKRGFVRVKTKDWYMSLYIYEATIMDYCDEDKAMPVAICNLDGTPKKQDEGDPQPIEEDKEEEYAREAGQGLCPVCGFTNNSNWRNPCCED